MSLPEVLSNCGATTFIRGAVQREELCKVSDDFLAKETVVYAIQDQFGNVSDTCVQVRYIKKPNLTAGDIVFPSDTIVSCDAAFFNSDGVIDPMIAGAPTWDGVDLYNNPDLPQLCNVFADFEDLQDLDVSCTRTIIRRWTVTEWRCEGGSVRIPMLQRIVLLDTTAPVLEIPSSRIDLSVNEASCTASFELPLATATDNCQTAESIEIEVRYPGGSSLLGSGPINLPIGEGQILEYIARDILSLIHI